MPPPKKRRSSAASKRTASRAKKPKHALSKTLAGARNPSYTAKVLANVMAPIEAWQRKRGKKVPPLTSSAYDRMVGEYWHVHQVVRGKSVSVPMKQRNPSRRMPAEAIYRNVYDDLNAMSGGGRGDYIKGWPEGHWGDVKIILSWLRGNELSGVADFFVRSMKKGPEKFAHEFYIDDRVYGSPVLSDWTKGRVGKRDVNAALKRLYAVGKAAKKNPNARLAAPSCCIVDWCGKRAMPGKELCRAHQTERSARERKHSKAPARKRKTKK